jgi:hypothetical protein
MYLTYSATITAEIPGVLCDFDFLDDFPQGGTIPRAVFSGDANFLSLLCHKGFLI